jgi:hypothetical protein
VQSLWAFGVGPAFELDESTEAVSNVKKRLRRITF